MKFDAFRFYQTSAAENDSQISSIVTAFHPSSNKISIFWNRRKNENGVKHDVRYAFSDIHLIGWNAASAAPNGSVPPPGSGSYCGMIYETTAINVAGQSAIYLAIKPQNSNLLSQVRLPLQLGTPPNNTIPGAPKNLRIQ